MGVEVRVGDGDGKGKLYAMKHVAAGAHLPTPSLFEPAKRSDDRADYCPTDRDESSANT